MILDYKTGKLPPNFIALGTILLAVGIWRIVIPDWKGLIFLLVSLILLLIRSGVIIDTDNMRLKEYIGLLLIKKGKWEDIKQLTGLRIVKSKETQTMSVLSISRIETSEVYKLFLVLPGKNIELMSGQKDHVAKRAKEVSNTLNIKEL